jgi:hypothetical protein
MATNLPDTWPQACVYVGRIFKGEKPSELPAVQPARFVPATNLKTAKTRHRGPANAAQPRHPYAAGIRKPSQERKLQERWKSANFRPCLRRFREPDNDATPHVLSTD